MKPLGIDRDLLASHLRNRLQEEALSIRQASKQIGCSAATLSRLIMGSTSDHKPDTATLAAAAAWLKRSLVDFDHAQRPRAASRAEIELLLRALPRFSSADVRVVMAVIEALLHLKRQRPTDK